MLGHDVAEVQVHRKVLKQRSQGFQATSRRADGNNKKVSRSGDYIQVRFT
jgi:hypothetical protein